MEHSVILRDVVKRYRDHLAVNRLSFAVPPGTVYGVLGPNGAGKSTTLRMILNILARDSGEISLLGRDPARDRSVLNRVGYLPEDRGLYSKMKVLDVISFFAEIRGLRPREARARGREWLERMGLAEWERAKIESLSKGMQQKVQFITTVLHEPELLILDEPFSGLDPVNQEVLRDTVEGARQDGRTVLFSTHVMDQAERICDHVCIIAQGRKVVDGNLREVRRAEAGSRYEIAFDREPPGFRELAGDPRIVREAEQRNGSWFVDLSPGTAPSDLLARLNGMEASLTRFLRVEPTLHEIFVNSVGEDAARHQPEEAPHA